MRLPSRFRDDRDSFRTAMTGQPQAYCWVQLEQCCEAIGGCTNGVAAGKPPIVE